MRPLVLRIMPVVFLAAYRAVSLALYAASWRLLIPARARPRFGRLLWLRWIGEAVNSLLPIAQVGGDVVRARLLAARTGRAVAGAAMIADLAIGVTTQAVFGIVGLAALAATGALPHLGRPVALALALALAAVGALVALLRGRPLRLLLSRLRDPRWLGGGRSRERWRALAGGAASLDAALADVARRPGDLALASALHLAGWLSHAGETWLGLALVGTPVSFAAALAIESLSSMARAAAFFIPGGIGVQEGTIVYLCRTVGVPLHAAVTLAVLKRAREIVVSALGGLAWAATGRLSLRRLFARLRERPRGSAADA
jgi:putative membrane protein